MRSKLNVALLAIVTLAVAGIIGVYVCGLLDGRITPGPL